jgi:hypothetical protein
MLIFWLGIALRGVEELLATVIAAEVVGLPVAFDGAIAVGADGHAADRIDWLLFFGRSHESDSAAGKILGSQQASRGSCANAMPL